MKSVVLRLWNMEEESNDLNLEMIMNEVTRMETMKQAVANAILELPDTANFSDMMTVLETLQQEFETVAENDSPNSDGEGISAYELAKAYIGCIDGPPDLSTNKAYFEGFGE